MKNTRRFLAAIGSTMILTAVVSASVFAQAPPSAVTFSHPDPFLDSRTVEMQGDKRPDGVCVWHPPALSLAPGETAVAARQVSANYKTCATVVEIGTPADLEPVLDSSTAPRVEKTSKSAAASRAYYLVRWEDIVGIKVNHVRSILDWNWNGTCVTSSIGSWGTYAQTGTGWINTYLNPWKTTGCDSHYQHTSADFRNSLFCAPLTTNVYYRDVRVRGGYAGGYGGQVASTWATGDCFPLHWEAELVKEY